jgi:hypothetical protein
MKPLILFVLLILVGLIAEAQTVVSGRVKSRSGEALQNVNVSLKNTFDGASTDSLGSFRFVSDETGRQVVQISSLNYEPDSVAIELSGKEININLVLKEAINELNTVVISAGTFEASDTKKNVILNSLDIATTAGATADIFGALQTLPGTQTSFSESGLFVRGGSAAETRSYFDGMLVKNPFNTQVPEQASRGRFSPFLFKGTSFSAGGYSAQYGQALSSALILESKDLPEKTTTGVSLLSVGAGLDQNIRFDKSAVSFGGFYYNLKPAFSLIKQRTDWSKEPEQFGGTFQYKLKTSKRGMFKWYSELSSSKIGVFSPDLNSSEQKSFFSNKNGNQYINTTYQENLSDKWKLNTGISYSNNTDNGLTKADAYGRTDRLVQGRVTATNYFGTLSSLKFGAETYRFSRDESWNELKRSYRDQMSSAFAETDLFFSNRLVARLGLRAEYSSHIREFNLAPRTSLSYKLNSASQVSLAYGRFYQNAEDGYLIQQRLDFEQADHYIFNYQRNSAGRVLRLETFYKHYDKLTKSVEGSLNNSGDGFAQGLDVFWRDKKSIKGVDYWVSYSYLDSKRNFRDYPVRAVPPFAAKHSLNVVYKKFFEKLDSQVGATYTFSSGRTYFNPNSSGFLADKTNSFNNLSVNVSYLTHILKQFTVVYISANNIPGFKNIYGYQYSASGAQRRAIEPPARRDLFIGLLMTIGDDTFVR